MSVCIPSTLLFFLVLGPNRHLGLDGKEGGEWHDTSPVSSLLWDDVRLPVELQNIKERHVGGYVNFVGSVLRKQEWRLGRGNCGGTYIFFFTWAALLASSWAKLC